MGNTRIKQPTEYILFLVGDNHELNMLLSDVFIKFLSECLRLEYLRLEMTRRVILAEKVAQCLHLIFMFPALSLTGITVISMAGYSNSLINVSTEMMSLWSRLQKYATRLMASSDISSAFSGNAKTGTLHESMTSAVTLPTRSSSFRLFPLVAITTSAGGVSRQYSSMTSSGIPSLSE